MLVQVLGPVEVTRDDGSRFTPPSGSQRKLLALLAIRAGRAVAPNTICDLFGLTPGAVRTTVSRMRKALGDALATEAQGYALRADTDVQRFQTLASSARTATPAQSIALRAEALQLFSQPVLEEFSDEPWAVAEVVRLTELRSAVVEDLIEGYISHESYDDAIDELHRHLIDHPYRDRPHELLMRAYAMSGRQVEALRTFQDYRAVLIEDVGVEPGPAIVELDRVISLGDLSALETPASEGTHTSAALVEPDRTLSNLHAPPNDFIGREAEIETIGQAVAESRLVTLLGPGGVGKTRLSYRVAAEQSESFSDGVWVAELVGSEDAADVVRTIASVFGLSGSDTAERCADQLSGHDVLLVLDNCEHLIEPLVDVLDTLLSRTARLRILATSRARLGVVGERTITISPLRTDGEAQDLFMRRALASGAAIGDQDMAAVGTICERLDGIPLALELAAASARVLAPTELLERLDDRFAILKGGPRGAVAGRHESLRAAVDSSYESLDEPTKEFFRRIAVFAGDFPLDAAEAAAEGLAHSAVELLADLVDRSLVTVYFEAGRSRYRLLETLRQYGQDRLSELDEFDAAVERHISWCLEHSARVANKGFGAHEASSLGELVASTPNFRLAISRLLERGDVERAAALILNLEDYAYASNTIASIVGPLIESRAVEDHPDAKRLFAIELIRRATIGSSETRRELAERLSAELVIDDPGTTQLPVLLIATALGVGPHRDYVQAVVERAREHPSTAEKARLLCAAGLSMFYGDQLPADLDLVEEAMAEADRSGMRRLTMAAASMACIGGLRLGQLERGAELARPRLQDLDELGHASIMTNGLIAMYSEAAMQAGLGPDEHLAAIRYAGPNLRGDFNRLGQALARLVQHQGEHRLAVRALGACEDANRSRFSSRQREAILDNAQQELSGREIEELLATGAVSEKTDLYREMWGVLESLMPT